MDWFLAAVSVSFQARDELNAIVDFYAKVGATGFSGVIEESILERLKSLIQYPRMGRIVPEIGDDSIQELL